jgi:hypothetical protein
VFVGAEKLDGWGLGFEPRLAESESAFGKQLIQADLAAAKIIERVAVLGGKSIPRCKLAKLSNFHPLKCIGEVGT